VAAPPHQGRRPFPAGSTASPPSSRLNRVQWCPLPSIPLLKRLLPP
jgi:hypothetical protein